MTEPRPDPDTDALEAAIRRVMAIQADPVATAERAVLHEQEMKGAYAVIRALMARLGTAKVVLARDEWMAPDPSLKLTIRSAGKGSVTLALVDRDKD